MIRESACANSLSVSGEENRGTVLQWEYKRDAATRGFCSAPGWVNSPGVLFKAAPRSPLALLCTGE